MGRTLEVLILEGSVGESGSLFFPEVQTHPYSIAGMGKGGLGGLVIFASSSEAAEYAHHLKANGRIVKAGAHAMHD